jgi:hypothetical protein
MIKVTTSNGEVNEISSDVISAPKTEPNTETTYANFDETIRYLNKDTFIRAEFINNERTHVRVWWKNPNRPEVEEDFIAVNMEETTSDGKEHPYLTRIFELTNLDEMHENTYRRIKNQEKMFREFAIKVAKEQGLVIDPIAYYDNESETSRIDTKFFGYCLALFFNDFDSEKQKEDLFIVKLASFELDMVKNCDNRELKSKLRKAKNPIEILGILLEIKNLK